MEKPVSSTYHGIFDMHTSLDSSNEIAACTEHIDTFQEIEIHDDELAGWSFFKSGEDERTIATMAFAEEWARRMQPRLASGEECADIWVECAQETDDSSVTSAMKYAAIRMLARHWKYRDELRAAFDEYWQMEGANQEKFQSELLEDHIG